MSTLVLAKYLSLFSLRSESAMIISLEQHMEIKKNVEATLVKYNLDRFVHILYSPLNGTGNYQINEEDIVALIGTRKVDIVLIDGPSGTKGCRIHTLPFIAKLCRPGAKWFLDDSFRDGELDILKNWSKMPGIKVEGVFPVEKGLGCGVVIEPSIFDSMNQEQTFYPAAKK